MKATRAIIEGATSWVEIDRSALIWNLCRLREMTSSNQLFMAVVKANAYGHGLSEVAHVALEGGADWLGVFSLDEGISLRSRGIDAPILALGPTRPAQLPSAEELEISLTVASLESVDALVESNVSSMKVHLKLETGTNRQGLGENEIHDVLARLGRRGIEVEGIYTHFADIEDTTDHRYAESQLARFETALSAIPGANKIPIPHAACSAATILFPSTHFKMVRLGISLYGLWPSSETRVSAKSLGRNALELRPAMIWKTRIAQIKELDRGEFIGYGRTYRTTRRSRIAVLPVGYADGYDRRLSNAAHVLVRGSRAPVRGRICMNVTMVDVTDVPSVSPGDEVVLLGSQKDETVSAEDLAALAGTINYEIVTRAAPGAPRILI